MNRYVKIILCITAIIIISILFCLTYSEAAIPEEIEMASSTAVMNDWQPVMIDQLLATTKPSPTPSEDNTEFFMQITNKPIVEEKTWVVTECKNEEHEKFIWDTLMRELDNEKIVAGIMGYFKRESGLKSNAIPSFYLYDVWKKCDSSAKYTAFLDAGLADGSTRDELVEIKLEDGSPRNGGYGLGQWFTPKYLNGLYDFAQEWGTSIGDAEMQCVFMAWSIQNQAPKCWERIKDADDIYQIGRDIAVWYDGASDIGQGMIIQYTVEYYNKYRSDV